MGRHVGVSNFFFYFFYFNGNIGNCVCEQLKVLSFKILDKLKLKTFKIELRSN